MRSPGLALLGLAGLLIVGYAFYVLLAPPAPRGIAGRSRGDASRKAEADTGTSEDAGTGDDGAAKGRGRKPVPRKKVVVDSAPTNPSPPPPRPEPTVSLADARRQFAEYMAELDGIAARDEELTSPEWVDLYKRGHDVLAPLQQNLDGQIPEQARELKMANEDMRAKLNKIDPNRPEPPPTSP